MAFRKRKKKSSGSHFKVAHHEIDGSSNIMDTSSSSSTSLSFQLQQHNISTDKNSARMLSEAKKKEKQRRKKRKMRIKATQRTFESRSRCTDNTETTQNIHSNVGIYTDDYLNTLKQQNKEMSVPQHIKQQIEEQKESIHDIEMRDNHNTNTATATNPIVIDDDEDDEIMKAKILTSKLKRRTQALINTVDEHSHKNKSKRASNVIDKDPLSEFIPLVQFTNERQQKQKMIDKHHYNEIDLTHSDDDAFEKQQIQKAGITIKKTEPQQSKHWNSWKDDDTALSLEDVNQLIDGEINGKYNLVKAPNGSQQRTYEEAQAEYVAMDNNFALNEKRMKATQEKHLFFKTLQNESNAYLNCLSEKTETMNNYASMNLYLREQKRILLAKERCWNDLEAYHEAFCDEDYKKDLQAADAYQTLHELNARNDAEIDANDSNAMNCKIWNKTKQTLDEGQYLLHKKRRHIFRSQQRMNKKRKLNEWYLNTKAEKYYFKKHEQLTREIKTIFEDTREEYRNFNTMYKLLEEWKAKYRREYDDAFISESIPKLIAPFVGLELMQWNSLKYKINICAGSDDESTIVSEPELFISHEWYQLMCAYGTDDSGSMEEDDSDDIIVPTLIASLVIPELVHIVECDWDPYNEQEAKQMILQINCALEHIQGYSQFNDKKQVLQKAVRQRCDAVIANFIELKCIPTELISKILPDFKTLPNKPVDGILVNKANLPNGAMYRYIKQRVWNALDLMESVVIVMDSVSCCVQMIENIYKSVIEGFVTYLARCPSRNAKDETQLKMIIVNDLRHIIECVCGINDKWKCIESDDDECDDVEMNGTNLLSVSIIKHMQRSFVEIRDNLNNAFQTKPNVAKNLKCLDSLISTL